MYPYTDAEAGERISVGGGFVVRYFLSSRFHGIMHTSITGKLRHLDGSHRKRPHPEKLVFHIFSALAQFEWRLVEGWTRARL